MINYSTESSSHENPFEHAEVGDKFCVISYSRYNPYPQSVKNYEVKKVGKRDIKCISLQNQELIVKVNSCMSNPYAYKCGGSEAINAVAIIRKFKRQYECYALVGGRSKRELFDDDLMDAIDAWDKRISSSKEE